MNTPTVAEMTQRVRGFSLIELLVAVAVLAIITTLAFPAFQAPPHGHRGRAATETVSSQMRCGRSASRKQYPDLLEAIPAPANWCVGISNATGCACGTAGSCQYGPAAALAENNVRAENFSGVSLAATQAELQIDSRRGGTATSTTLTLTGGSSKEGRVTITPLGRVSICGNVGGYASC